MGSFHTIAAGASGLTSKDFRALIGPILVVLACLTLSGCSGAVKAPEVKAVAASVDAPQVISCLGRLVAGDGPLKIASTPQAIVSELRVRRGSKVAGGATLAVL